jgi:glycosyltransferase involved in cell wall biosynthesis
MKNITYIAYTGMSEPLGRSQVIPYINILGSVHLVSFEKKRLSVQDKSIIRRNFKSNSIRWSAKKYHKSPRLVATFFDLISMLIILKKDRKMGVQYVHCRGYITAISALMYSFLYPNTRYIFDMRAFWPDEMVTSGTLKKSSFLYFLLKKIEKYLIIKSHATIVLTHAAYDYLLSNQWGASKKIFVIPTCVDHDKFNIAYSEKNSNHSKSITIGTVGTINNSWFLMEEFCIFISIFKTLVENTKIRIVTQDNAKEIKRMLLLNNVREGDVQIYPSTSENMPKEIRSYDALIMFFTSDFSKLGSAPTRFGEALASGVPCVVNSGVGDIGNIVESEGVGVVVNDLSSHDEMKNKCKDLVEIINSNIDTKCRYVSKKYFSLQLAKIAYDEIYK